MSTPPKPYFESARAPGATRRLLVISYSFPPDSSVGALRWEKLVHFAVARGWSVDVLTMDPADASPRDDSRLATLPPRLRAFAVKLRPSRYLAVERWLRGQLGRLRHALSPSRGPGVPGSRSEAIIRRPPAGWRPWSLARPVRSLRRMQLVRLHYNIWLDWASRAADLGVLLSAEVRYDLIVSSGPPHEAHIAARRISAVTGAPSVMDLRDLWSGHTAEPPDLAGPTWRRMTGRLEASCMAAARLVVANTPAMERLIRERYPYLGARLFTVMNGADPDVESRRPLAATFTIVHTGTLYAGRDPRSLMRGLRRAADRLGLTPADIRLRFVGATEYDGTPLHQMATEAGGGEFLVLDGKVTRGEALRAQEESAMLVVLPQDQAECIPGKVFEYVQLSSWILVLTTPDSAAAQLLLNSAVDVVAPEDDAGIADVIVARYREFRAGVRPAPANRDGRFDRAHQAAVLFDAFDRILGQPPAASASDAHP